MFSTFKQRLLLGVYVFILLTIPIGAYLASQSQTFKSKASEEPSPAPTLQVPAKPSTSPAKELLTTAEKELLSEEEEEDKTASSSSSSPEIATSYGPTLAFKAKIEGRPEGNQATRIFVGIMEGLLTANPKFLLSFTVDLPASGEYSNLSLAGLNAGTQYTALLKGSNQIATSSAFTMAPAVSNLNGGEPLALRGGDLNDDNVVNTADYSLALKAYGATPASVNWNENADFNSDGVINSFDLSLIKKNMGQTGASGAWTSPIPKVATASAGFSQTSTGGPNDSSGYSPERESKGHWIWVPAF